MQSCCVILFQQFPKFIMWQLIVLENKRLKQWGIIKGELCALPLDREDAGSLQPASIKGKEFPIGKWGIPEKIPGLAPGVFFLYEFRLLGKPPLRKVPGLTPRV